MQIDSVKQFLFYPLDDSHTTAEQIASVIVNIALTCLTLGVYLAAFAAVHLYDYYFEHLPEEPPKAMIPTPAEILAKHNREDDCWVAIAGKVYDITKFMGEHPGGVNILLDRAGKDATSAFEDVGHSQDARKFLQHYYIGELENIGNFVKK